MAGGFRLDRDAYLARIGYDGPRTPSAAVRPALREHVGIDLEPELRETRTA